MTFAVKSQHAVFGVMYIALGAFGCAEGSATKASFDETLDNGSSAERDAGANGADPSGNDGGSAGTSGGNGIGVSGGGASGGNASAGNASGGTGNTGGTGLPIADGGTNQDAGVTCLPGTDPCGVLCVDLKSSASNCGRCGHACPGGQACNGAGVCLAPAGCTLLSFENHDYITCEATKNWADARKACLDWGMDLALIESAAENAFLSGQPGWFGYNDITTEGSWLSVTVGGAVNGPLAPYTNWKANEPNNDTNCGLFCTYRDGEDCAETLVNGLWNDARCDASRRFLCETY